MTEKEQPQQKQVVETLAEFKKCPRCGSTARMMETLGKEMKEQGLIGEDLDVGLNEMGGPLVDPRKANQMLSMSTRPGHFAMRDVCLSCGEIYVVKITRKPVVLGVGVPPQAGGLNPTGPGMNPGLGRS